MAANQGKILWVDDEIDLLKSHIVYLTSRGYEVTQATNGPDAIELIHDNPVDLVLLDEMMPVMNGLEVLKRIKGIRSDLPVVMVTKNEAEDLMEEAIGSQIDAYLTKPVNPSQVLSVLKGLLQGRRISTDHLARTWAAEFADLSRQIDRELDADGWTSLHNRLCLWEQRLDDSGEQDYVQTLREARLEADRMFGKWVERHYPEWVASKPGERPALSTDIVDRWLIPNLSRGGPVMFLVIDCLRMDQWAAIEPLLGEYFDVRRDAYFAVLPTATPYARNAIFSGLFPNDLEKVHPEIWAGSDEDEASSNRLESLFLLELLKRREISLKPDPKYVKVLDVDEINEFERRVDEYTQIPLTSMVYNFVDILIHTRQSVEILKEMLPDEAAFRSVTRAWFQHAALFRVLQAYAERGGTVVLTSDHGSIRGRRGSKVIGDRYTSTSLRYKHGRNLKVSERQAVRIRRPAQWGLPARGVNTEYIIAREDFFFLYPTNFNRYLELYRDSFQHGGISLDEMVLPVVTLTPKS